MPISKDSFDTAKAKANERLQSWIAEAKSESGLDNLHSKFGQVFKKIKYSSGEHSKGRSERTDQDVPSRSKTKIKVKKKHARGRRNSANLLYGENRNCSRASLKGYRPSTRDSDLMIGSEGVGSAAARPDLTSTTEDIIIKVDTTEDAPIEFPADKSHRRTEEKSHLADIHIGGPSVSDTGVSDNPMINVSEEEKMPDKDYKKPSALLQHKTTKSRTDLNQDKLLIAEKKNNGCESKQRLGMSRSGSLGTTNMKISPSNRQCLPLPTVTSDINIPDKKAMVTTKSLTRQRSARRRKGKPCVRLKMLGKKIACVMRLIKGCNEALKKSEMKDRTLFAKDSGNIDFDTSQFSPETCENRISRKEKSILRIVPEYRTEKHLEDLKKVVYRLPMFFKYSRKIKKELARYLFYDQYENGRVMVRQGDIGQYMYFIISGAVSVYQMLQDDDGKKIGKHLMDLPSGSTFGNIALMRDTERIATIVCKGASEFLILDKTEFKKILSEKFENEYKKIERFFDKTDYFKNWPQEETDILIQTAVMREYSYDQVILGNTTGLTDNLYFIRRGYCDIVKTIFYTKEEKQYWPSILHPTCSEERNRALSNIYSKKTRSGKLVRHLVVGRLQAGDYFGAGENLKNVHYITRGKVQIISVSSARYEICGRNEELRNMAMRRNEEIPSTKKAHHKYLLSKQWYLYKQKLVKEIKNKRNIPITTKLSDVPRYCREEPRINLKNF